MARMDDSCVRRAAILGQAKISEGFRYNDRTQRAANESEMNSGECKSYNTIPQSPKEVFND